MSSIATAWAGISTTFSGTLLCQCMMRRTPYPATGEATFWWKSEVARVLTADEVKEAEMKHVRCVPR